MAIYERHKIIDEGIDFQCRRNGIRKDSPEAQAIKEFTHKIEDLDLTFLVSVTNVKDMIISISNQSIDGIIPQLAGIIYGYSNNPDCKYRWDEILAEIQDFLLEIDSE